MASLAQVTTSRRALPPAPTAVSFTDEPLVPGVTPIRAVHLTEVRVAVNIAREQASLPAVVFTDDPLSDVVVKALHISELRSALDEARSALGLHRISYTDPTIQSGGTRVKAAHIQELRDGARVGPSGCSAITVTNPAKTAFTVASPVAETFLQSGAINGATFSVVVGMLPPALTLSSSGALSGSPNETGMFSFTVGVTDGKGCSGVGQPYSIQVVEAPVIVSFTVTGPKAPGGAIALTPTFSGGSGVITNDQNPDTIVAASGTSYEVTATSDTLYTLTVTNAAGDQVTTSVTYAVPAFARINEVNANLGGSCDLIELRVISAGDMAGLKLQERTGSTGELTLTFPSFRVQVNDIIVVHLNSTSSTCNPGGATQETGSKDEQRAFMFGRNYDTAYDFYSTDTGLSNTDNVFVLFNAGGSIIDALFVSNDPTGTSTSTATETAAAAVGSANQWVPALASYPDNIFRQHAAHDLDATGTLISGTSIQRLDNTDDNDKADWTTGAGTGSSWGALNAGQSAGASLVINEVDYDQIGTDSAEFIEIYNPTPLAVDLTNITVMLVDGATNTVYATIDLASIGTLGSEGYVVIAGPNVVTNAGATKLDPGWTAAALQNGAPDGIALVDKAGPVLLDAFSYEGSITAATLTGFSTPVSLVEGTPLAVDTADSNTAAGSLCRVPNGVDSGSANADWRFCSTVTPGGGNP